MASQGQRRDSKRRILHTGESIRANGKYQYKYMVDGKAKFLYSWRLVPTDPQPVGKQPCLSLRELEKMVQQDLDSKLDPMGKKMTVNELIDRYLQTRTGVKPNTLINYKFVKNLMEKEDFGSKKIAEVKTSDAKFLQNYFLLNCSRMEKAPAPSKPFAVFLDQPFRWQWMMTLLLRILSHSNLPVW